LPSSASGRPVGAPVLLHRRAVALNADLLPGNGGVGAGLVAPLRLRGLVVGDASDCDGECDVVRIGDSENCEFSHSMVGGPDVCDGHSASTVRGHVLEGAGAAAAISKSKQFFVTTDGFFQSSDSSPIRLPWPESLQKRTFF
jgi:hypothetical protein